jgi:hypothetical protein
MHVTGSANNLLHDKNGALTLYVVLIQLPLQHLALVDSKEIFPFI